MKFEIGNKVKTMINHNYFTNRTGIVTSIYMPSGEYCVDCSGKLFYFIENELELIENKCPEYLNNEI